MDFENAIFLKKMLFWTFSFLDQMCIFAPVCVSSITSDMKYSYKKHNLTVLKLGWLNLKVLFSKDLKGRDEILWICEFGNPDISHLS